MPKFVARQRKHKVLARSKARGTKSELSLDSNAIEHVPATQTELEEKKRRIREELLAQNYGRTATGKKAKRLEKYIENKLKKDENRELISKLAESRTDTSHYTSSKRLGQGKESKKEKLIRALRDKQAGIDIDGDNDDLLFRKATIGEPEDFTFEKTVEHEPSRLFNSTFATEPSPERGILAGGGLKRPLDLDEDGKPILKKRKRRGSLKSRADLHPVVLTEPEWEGFSSCEDNDDKAHRSGNEEATWDEADISNDKLEVASNSSTSSSSELESDNQAAFSIEESSDEIDESEDDSAERAERSSAFKSWATQQLNEAIGYQPGYLSHPATETPTIVGFEPRVPEQDPLPAELRPTTNLKRKAFSVSINRNPAIQNVRLQLPVVAEEQKIMEAVHENNIIVIYGATGSGKTTQVPQFLYEAGYGATDSSTPGMIGVTQPRRVAAVSMSKRVSEELGDHGKKVAYQIRFEGTVDAKTAIKFMTDGVLLREVAQDIALRKYSAIIIDEAHERSVNTDILIGMLSRVVKLREEMAQEDKSIKPLKLIIMSATLRVTDFTENKTLFKTPPPVLQAEGRQYSVTTHFSRRTHHDYVEALFKKISRGHRKLPPGGFLIFLTGQNEIVHLGKRLKEAFRVGQTSTGPPVRIPAADAAIEVEDIEFGDSAPNLMSDDYDDDDDDAEITVDDDEFEIGEETDTGPAKMHILPLYSLLPTKEQLRVFEPPPEGSRLIVLATNVAETSLTIPGIRYVFDGGRSKERKFDQMTGVQSFEIGWISQASASQRAGRAGRTGPGHCYRLYSSAVYERDFQKFAKPEILRMPIEGVVLQLKAMNLQNVVNFPFPTPPNSQSLATSEKLLTYLSAITPSGQITKTGSTMSVFPLSPRFARILLVGHLHDCLSYTIALVAGLSAADVFMQENQIFPKPAEQEKDGLITADDRKEEAAQSLKRRHFNKTQKDFCFLDDKSDAIKLLQVVGEFAHEPTEPWCSAHYVQYKPLKEISQLRRQITDLLRINISSFAGLEFQEKLPAPTPTQVKALKQMVATGFIDHIAIRADLAPIPPDGTRKPTRAIDVAYLTLFPSHIRGQTDDSEADSAAQNAVFIHPSSPLAHLSPQECPEYIVYSYLQRGIPSAATPNKIPKTRMHALTDINGGQLAALAKGTPLIHYGKPIKEVPNGNSSDGSNNTRECWVIPYLRPDGLGSMGWPLPARKVVQKKVPGQGWVVQ